jgi:hypothetical protein
MYAFKHFQSLSYLMYSVLRYSLFLNTSVVHACPLTLSPLMCVYIMVRLDGFEPENYCVCGLDGAPAGILSKLRISTILMYT